MCRFARAVKRKLNRLGKTQKDIADTLHYSPSYISGVIHGKSNKEMREIVKQLIRKWEQEAEEGAQ